VKIVSVFIFEDGPDIILILYALEILRDALDVLDIILTKEFPLLSSDNYSPWT
jgi:hypothetical protein